uniref:VIT family protein n=1 Tax=Caldiarchaeum subterraneum TaxID=311458 RepID=A0A7C5Y737_CALS0
MNFFADIWSNVQRSLEISEKQVAIRRYFFSNSFDGVLAMMGLSLGAAIVPGTKISTVVFAGLGTAIAMLVSGVSGIYLTESAETRRLMREIQESMLRDVSDTVIGKAAAIGTLIVSFVGGFSNFLLSMAVLLPYIVSLIVVELQPMAPALSAAVALVILFVLGMFLGKFSRINIVMTGLRMAGLGIITAALILLVELLVS